MRTCSKLGVLGVTLFGALVAQPAAAERPTVRTATVHAADIDMTSEHDVRVLYERILYAAQAICAATDTFDTMSVVRRRQCVRSAVREAVDEAGTPLLMAVHLEQNARMTQL